MNKKFIHLSMLAGILSWILYAVYFFCSKENVFWENLNSTIHTVGVNAMNLAAILSIAGVILSTIILVKFKTTKYILLNIIVNYSIFLEIFAPVFMLYIAFAL